MKPEQIALLTVIVLCGLAAARPMYVLADPNTPAWADPNQITGTVLPAIRTDPNNFWTHPTGKMVRVAPYIEEDGQAITVVCADPNWTVSVNPVSGTWTLAGDVLPGANYIRVSASDIPGPYQVAITNEFTVLVWGIPPENINGPVLQ